MHMVSVKKSRSSGREHGRVKENKKILYHFANFAIVNELFSKNRRIRPAYWLMQARDEMRPPCQRVVRRAGVVYYKRQWLRTNGA